MLTLTRPSAVSLSTRWLEDVREAMERGPVEGASRCSQAGVRRWGGAERKGDHSIIGTTTSAFRKAYTVVTFGPIFRFDASIVFAALAAKNPSGAAIAT
jgi:hypothetical protein